MGVQIKKGKHFDLRDDFLFLVFMYMMLIVLFSKKYFYFVNYPNYKPRIGPATEVILFRREETVGPAVKEIS